MPRIKPKRSTPRLDMTPMVDLAFLLVTFFMLTATAKPQEAAVVDVPPSSAEKPIPDLDMLLITVAKDGKVYLDLSGNKDKATGISYRATWASKMNDQYKLGLTENEMTTFSNLSSFGVPLNSFKAFLDMPASERKVFQDANSIPYDSAHNELTNWILNARLSNGNLRVAIKGDRDADFKAFKDVIKIVQDKPNNINRFNLITTMATGPGAAPAKK
jgi:biopolymer transport protein ExbD